MSMLTSSAFFADLFDLPWNLIKDQASATARISNGVNESSNSGNAAVSSVATPLTLDELILHEVIDIDLSTKDLQLFFGYMQAIARFQFLMRPFFYEIGIDQARFLLSLIDQYECEAMRSALYERLRCLADQHPWEILHIACNKDNLELGRYAIRSLWFRLYDFVGSDRKTPGWIGLSKLSDSWKAEFLRLLLPGPERHDTILLMELDSETFHWSEKFNPGGYQEESDMNGKRKRV
jgi:hypothetical protein